MDTQTVYRDISLLNPEFGRRVTALRQDLVTLYETKRIQFRFEIFETFRSPKRQIHLRAEGTSKAGPWQSAHQYGLAADFVPFLNEVEAARVGRKATGWYWPEVTNEAWKILGERAAKAGLVRPINWDKPHVEDPRFDDLYQMMWK